MIPFGQTMMMTNRSIDGRISSCVISNIARHTSKNIPDEGVNIIWTDGFLAVTQNGDRHANKGILGEGANMIFAGLRQEEFHETERIC